MNITMPGPLDFAAAIGVIGAVQLAFTWVFHRRMREEFADKPPEYSPALSVIVPCKGRMDGLAENIASLFATEYAGKREFLFATPSDKDPAYEAIRDILAGHPGVRARLLASNAIPLRCNDQALNLYYAAGQMDPESEVLLCADGDIRFAKNWMRDLVSPLGAPQVGITTTTILTLPENQGIWSLLRLAWLVWGSAYYAVNPWVGGQFAMRKKDFDRLRIGEAWLRCLGTDICIGRCIQEQGGWDKTVLFVGRATSVCLEDSGPRALFSQFNRWSTVLKHYAPGTWLLGSIVTGVKAGAYATALLSPISWPLLLWTAGLDIVNMYALCAVYRKFLPERLGTGPNSPQPLELAAIAPLLTLIYQINFLSSAFTRDIPWGGYVYRLRGPTDVEVLHHRPAPLPWWAMFACAAGGGALLAMSVRPGEYPALAWFALVPVFWAAMDGTRIDAFFRGWAAGTALWVVGMSWLIAPMDKILTVGTFERSALYLLFCAGHGLMFAAAAWAMRTAAPEGSSPWKFLAVSTAAFLCAEEFYPMVFPYRMAFTQYPHLEMLQIVEVTGIAGASALLIACNAALYLALQSRYFRRAVVWKPLAAMAVLLLLNQAYGSFRIAQVSRDAAARLASGNSIKVGLVQGAIHIDPKRFIAETFESNLRIQNGLTHIAVENGAELVVWPESSYTYHRDVRFEEEDGKWVRPTLWDRKLQNVLRYELEPKTDMLVNAYSRIGKDRTYNTALLVSPDSGLLGVVIKNHLAPFGEYLPLAGVFPRLSRLFRNANWLTAGREQRVLTTSQGARLGIAICYEDLIPEYNRRYARHHAEVLISMANGWEFDGPALEINLLFSTLRAIETRRFLLRAMNTGISAVIHPTGKVLQHLAPGERGVLVAEAAKMDSVTPFMTLGRTVYYAAGIFLFFCLLKNRRTGSII